MPLLLNFSPFPVMKEEQMIYDVGDIPTLICRSDELQHFCFSNTFNDEKLIDTLDEPFKSFHVDRCIGPDRKVMWMHLGRGTPKTQGTYQKTNRVYLPEWIDFCGALLEDSV